MLTTTPFFRPREGCEPMPITSIWRSDVISPTMATTFDVPISSPTIKLRSGFLGIGKRPFRIRFAGDACVGVRPTHCESVAVAHVHVTHFSHSRRDQRARSNDEAVQALGEVLPP